ncbi:MAG: aryl-sulfate sulfotransferase [Woeseiaceae bacterium]
MAENSFKLAGTFVLAASATLIACAPAGNQENSAAAAPVTAAGPMYISNKPVSTDCGVSEVHTGSVPPGFAMGPGIAAKPMPPPLAEWQAVGADRPIAETVADKVAPGVTLIDPGARKPFYLINNDKEVIGEFSGEYYSFMQLLPNGNIIGSSNMFSSVFEHGGGHTGCIEEYEPDGTLVYRLALATDDYIHHHDLEKLPNGNILAVIWERVSADVAIAHGRNPEHVTEETGLWFDAIVEINPQTAEIVWEWNLKHHLIQDFDPNMANYGVVADNPGKLDINAIRFDQDGETDEDWTHVNALDYNAELDQIVFSANHLHEVYVIDHSTSPYESQTDAGDFLYRWGNNKNYQKGDDDSMQLFAQHDVHWIEDGLPGAGNLLIFNNGHPAHRAHTTVVELETPMNADGSYNLSEDGTYGPAEPVWEYVPKEGEEFFSWFISGAQRLANGNTLVNHGAKARLREVTPEGDIVWEYEYDDGADGPHMLFRAYRYPEDHPGILAITGANAQ